MTEGPLPSLKLITIDPSSADSLAAVRRVLAERLGEAELQRLFSHGVFVNTELNPSELRDIVLPALGSDQEVLVAEFERWSARGDSIDATWLMRRGH